MSVAVIDSPKIYLVGRQTIDEATLNDFLKDEGVEGWTTDTDIAAQRLVECAGRLCYKSYAKPRPGGNQAYIGHILEAGHGSVLESAVFNFIITGVSRSFTHELIRHRAGFGYSQLSQRFVDESGVPFVIPPLILRLSEKHPWLRMRWERAVETAQSAYADLSDDLNGLLAAEAYGLSGEDVSIPYSEESETDEALRWLESKPREFRGQFRKPAREAARSVLPNAAETQIFVTGNARALRTFLEQRGDAAADAEIRRVAVAMLGILQHEAGNLFGDMTVSDGSISTPYHKV